MFSKQGESAIRKDLTNTRKLCAILNNPQQKFKSVHIAGTNGKGSCSHMLSAVLQTAGYKTGLYTSPHLLDFRERIRINGEMITKDEVIAFVTQYKDIIEEIQPSFFEVTVAMAFHFFAQHQVDFAVVETGLGGRLDSTNIIHPVLSLITNISLDHTHLLGNTLQEIAVEKAGIIKPGTPVIISEEEPETATIFQEKARENHSKITFATSIREVAILERTGDRLIVEARSKINKTEVGVFELDLAGLYQRKNINGVLATIDKLRSQGVIISGQHIHYALSHVKQLTGLMGRWQVLQHSPLIICDTGHNQEGWKEVLMNIQQHTFNRLHMVMGIMRDKDLESLLRILPKEAFYYFCSASLERALPQKELLKRAVEHGFSGESFSSVEQAVLAAKTSAEKNDLIFIGGSTFIVAEALTILPL